MVKSGILSDVRITPDARLNILIVSAPAESMDLLATLIRQLDSPGFVAQIKVFTLKNADAAVMIRTLQSLLPAQVGAGTPQLAVVEGEPSTIGMRFSADPRTNSIIAVGSEGNLRIIEALLLRLDALDVQQRQTTVYRLKNAPANDVANSVNLFLRTERQVQQAIPGTMSPFQQIESEVVVVAEPVSNSLILSATPRFYKEIMDLVEKLDAQPSQVMIQVLIADVALRNTDEFGIEMGLQDSVLFDRSALTGNLQAQTTTQQVSTPSGIVTATEQNFPAASLMPGFDFINNPLGNAASNRSLASASRLGPQAGTALGLQRMNNELGFGGLVLSASSESVSLLIRALKENSRLEVLGRPHIMTLDNQPAFIQIGKRVPRITATSFAPGLNGSQMNQITLENVGLILGVTPRISPEGMVVMEIDAERSEIGPENEGIPVSFAGNQIIRSPTINLTMAQTTVSAADGETIVLGGLITKNTNTLERKVPYLADIPVVGNLFRYDFNQVKRNELLIVLTPHVVRSADDAERIKRIESARMHWCLDDVQQIHGDAGLNQAVASAPVIYPHTNPRGMVTPRQLPLGRPNGSARQRQEEVPTPSPAQEPNDATMPQLGPDEETIPPTPPPPANPEGARRDARESTADTKPGPALGNPLRHPAREAADRRSTAPSRGPALPAVYDQDDAPSR